MQVHEAEGSLFQGAAFMRQVLLPTATLERQLRCRRWYVMLLDRAKSSTLPSPTKS
jgi:hypothetical protein